MISHAQMSTSPISVSKKPAVAGADAETQHLLFLWVGLAAAVMLAELFTGPSVHLAVWYTVPVGLAAWYGGQQWGVSLAAGMPILGFAMFLFGLAERSAHAWAAATFNLLSEIAALSLVAVVTSHVARQNQLAVVKVREAEASRQHLERQLKALEGRAESAPLRPRIKLLSRAAELCAIAGERARAAVYYGRAIDALLESGYYDRAGAVCRKLIRVFPEVVRAHATLAVLAIGKHLNRDAERHLEDYVGAAIWAERESLTRARLRAIAEATDDEQIRGTIAHHLWQLGDQAGSKNVLYPQQMEASDTGDANPPLDAEERWQRLIRVARMGPSELRDWE